DAAGSLARADHGHAAGREEDLERMTLRERLAYGHGPSCSALREPTQCVVARPHKPRSRRKRCATFKPGFLALQGAARIRRCCAVAHLLYRRHTTRTGECR